jgi:hypothetical protein
MKIPSREVFEKALEVYMLKGMTRFIETLEIELNLDDSNIFAHFWIDERPNTVSIPDNLKWYDYKFSKLGQYLEQIEVDIETETK